MDLGNVDTYLGEESSLILIVSRPLIVFVREYLFMYIIT